MAPARHELTILGKALIPAVLLLGWAAGGPVPAIASEGIVLEPLEVSNEVGYPHLLVATVTDAGGQPVAGRAVDFAILSGPHAGLNGTSLTDSNGQAFFTYTGTAGGIDTIVASFIDADGIRQTSNAAYKIWMEPLCGNGSLDPGEDCEPETLCAGSCNPASGVCRDIGCNSDCTCPCGNGINEPREECDDGNHIREDGCSPDCLIEWCPLGVGFWRNHPEAWEVYSLELGIETYSNAELLGILETPPGSGNDADASLVLAHQMIATKLNVARGSAVTSEIFFIFAFRDPLRRLPGRLPYDVDPDSPTGEQLISAAGVLERYNKGKFTPQCVSRTM